MILMSTAAEKMQRDTPAQNLAIATVMLRTSIKRFGIKLTFNHSSNEWMISHVDLERIIADFNQ